jgi:HK97 family phage prohead protease
MPKDPQDTALNTFDLEVKFQTAGEGEIVGMAAIYGGEPDRNGDVIAAGAMTDSLAQIVTEGAAVPMLMSHDPGRVIGKWVKLTETDAGLKAHGKFTIDADEGRNAYALAKDEAMTGLSIGDIVRASEPRTGGGRPLTDIQIVEISLVTFPANDRARVTETKAQKAAIERADDTRWPSWSLTLHSHQSKVQFGMIPLRAHPAAIFFANDLPNLYSYCRTRVHLRTQELLMNSEDVGKKTRAPLTPPKRRGSHATGRAAP